MCSICNMLKRKEVNMFKCKVNLYRLLSSDFLLQMQTWLPPSPSGLCLNITFSARPSWTLHIKPPHPAPWPSLSSPLFLPLGMHAWHSLCFAYLLSIWPPSTPRGSRPGAAWRPVCFVHCEAQWVLQERGCGVYACAAAEFTHVLLRSLRMCSCSQHTEAWTHGPPRCLG